MSEQEEKFDFGIRALDERHLDGIPKGSTIAVIGPSQGPATQYLGQYSGLRETLYLTTEKPRDVVETEAILTSSEYESDKELPETLNVREYHKEDNSEIDDYIRDNLSQMGDEENFIVDNFTSLSEQIESKTRYYTLIRDIYNTTQNKKGVTMLYFIGESYSDLTDKEKEAINILDGVFLFETDLFGQSVETDLMIYKLRGMGTPDRTTFRLKTGHKIQVDSSQEIA